MRSFFTPTKTLANYIVKPNGLDFLIDEWKIIGETLDLNLSIEMPKAIVNDNTVAHLIWTRFNEDTYKSWTSVYNNIFNTAVALSSTPPISKLAAGIPVEALPPIRENTKWNYRGVYNGDNILILELISVTGIVIPFKCINYYHPAIKKRNTLTSNDKFRRIHTKNEGEIYKLPDNKGQSSSGKKQQYQPTIETSVTSLLYTEEVKLIRVKEGLNLSEKGFMVANGIQGKGNSKLINRQIATTQDWCGGGKIDSLEFKGLDIVKGKLRKGLEHFYRVMEYIRENYEGINISMCEVFLPPGRSFSYYPDGDRRNCAIVRVEFNNILCAYMLEVGKIEEWSISNLIIKNSGITSNSTNYNMDVIIINLLERLIINAGHWDNEILNKTSTLSFYKLKHLTNENIKKYAHRIITHTIK